MKKTDILGVQLDAITREQLFQTLKSWLQDQNSRPRMMATTYSEFIVAAQKDEEFKKILNNADINLADGIGMLWASSFLNRKTTDFFSVIREFIISAWQTVFDQEKIKDVIPEQIAGADVVWDICRLAAESGNTVFLLGAYGDVAAPILAKFPNLKIAGRYEGDPDEDGLVERINVAGADILLVAFGPIRQEYWLYSNRANLRVKLAVGLGGTFDYIMGKRPRAGQFWRSHGLEWLHRLVTQPWRWRRMWNAIAVFSWLILKEKIHPVRGRSREGDRR